MENDIHRQSSNPRCRRETQPEFRGITEKARRKLTSDMGWMDRGNLTLKMMIVPSHWAIDQLELDMAAVHPHIIAPERLKSSGERWPDGSKSRRSLWTASSLNVIS